MSGVERSVGWYSPSWRNEHDCYYIARCQQGDHMFDAAVTHSLEPDAPAPKKDAIYRGIVIAYIRCGETHAEELARARRDDMGMFTNIGKGFYDIDLASLCNLDVEEDDEEETSRAKEGGASDDLPDLEPDTPPDLSVFDGPCWEID